MFKNREITLHVSKKNKNEEEDELEDERTFEEKAEAILALTERFAVRAFTGLCVYMTLDTMRKTRIEKAKHNPYV